MSRIRDWHKEVLSSAKTIPLYLFFFLSPCSVTPHSKGGTMGREREREKKRTNEMIAHHFPSHFSQRRPIAGYEHDLVRQGPFR